MDPDVRQAEKDAADARALLDDLKRRVVEGDTSITPRDLAEHNELVDFAELLVEQTKTRVAETRKADRQRRYTAFANELAHFTSNSAALLDAYRAAEHALAHLYETTRQRHERLLDISNRGQTLQIEAQQHGEEGDLKAAGVWSADPMNGITYRRRCEDGSLDFRRRADIQPHEAVELAIRNAIVKNALQHRPRYLAWPKPSEVAGQKMAREFPDIAGPSMPGHGTWPA
ncbi:hypothetical protein Nocox_36930 [Nonomuraea coxensis DSM 45129]|uniref:Uncharacterized protein n=2 Tax=Nonomuraea coxensis TaxID=404386 RepID=A0ABX8UBK9_9ACTN|nr:hypothetical protein Nocox_36930 [Nonomuraea coxensis DSM 45129]